METAYRHQLTDVFRAAITAVQGRRCVAQWLNRHPIVGPVHLIAIGKAAAGMARGALDALPTQIEEGLIITKSGHCEQSLDSGIHCVESAHPVPDATSLEAGSRLLHFIQAIPLHSQTLVLISGGASSLVEVLPQQVTLEKYQCITQWLLGHRYSIDQINYVRKQLSCIKAGRLAQYFADRRVICLLISDVRGDDPGTIGSGLLVAERNNQRNWVAGLPEDIQALLHCAPPLPASNDPCFNTIVMQIVARLSDAEKAAAEFGRSMGWSVHLHEEFIAGDALEAGRTLAQRLADGPDGLHIWGGETTVELPPNPGRGGRNQSLALAAAEVLANIPGVFLLSGGTDGTDGPGEFAGAFVDGGTVERGVQRLGAGATAKQYLVDADAGTFLQASGDLLYTGPTGTNVMDLILGLKVAP